MVPSVSDHILLWMRGIQYVIKDNLLFAEDTAFVSQLGCPNGSLILQSKALADLIINICNEIASLFPNCNLVLREIQ